MSEESEKFLVEKLIKVSEENGALKARLELVEQELLSKETRASNQSNQDTFNKLLNARTRLKAKVTLIKMARELGSLTLRDAKVLVEESPLFALINSSTMPHLDTEFDDPSYDDDYSCPYP